MTTRAPREIRERLEFKVLKVLKVLLEKRESVVLTRVKRETLEKKELRGRKDSRVKRE